MKSSRTLSIPDLALLVGTRFALGVGVGLLLAGQLNRGMRVGAGRALVAVRVLTTIPLAIAIVDAVSPRRVITMAAREETEAVRAV